MVPTSAPHCCTSSKMITTVIKQTTKHLKFTNIVVYAQSTYFTFQSYICNVIFTEYSLYHFCIYVLYVKVLKTVHSTLQFFLEWTKRLYDKAKYNEEGQKPSLHQGITLEQK